MTQDTPQPNRDAPAGRSGIHRRVTLWRTRLGIVPVAIALGVGALFGLGAFTFGYGQGAAYLSNDPAACANCHVMDDHYDSWQNSGHAHVAVCNDCHLPHTFVGKWVTKMDNGFFHSLAFTTGGFHEPIQIKPRNRRVTTHACIACHREFINLMLPPDEDGQVLPCVHCHANVGHRGRL